MKTFRLTLWVSIGVSLLTGVATGQPFVYVHGVPFKVERVAQRDDTVLIEFEDGAIFTQRSNMEKAIVEYYFSDTKPVDIQKAEELLRNSLGASDTQIAKIALKRACKLSTESKEILVKLAYSQSDSKPLIDDFLPPIDPDPDCLIYPVERELTQHNFVITDLDLFYAKLASSVNRALEAQDPSLIPKLAAKVSLIVRDHPSEAALRHPELKLLELLFSFVDKSGKISSDEDLLASVEVKDLDGWVDMLWKTGALNCRNYVTLVANLINQAPAKMRQIYQECVNQIFTPSILFRNEAIIKTYCLKNTKDCEERFFRLATNPQFYEHSKNVELLFDISNDFSQKRMKSIRNIALYELHRAQNKPLLKLIETKYRESLSVQERLLIFVKKNIIKAIVLTTLVAFLGFWLFKVKSRKETEREDTQTSSFVKISRSRQDSEFIRYKELLRKFGLKPDADMRQIKKVYFDLSKQYHPDTFKGDSSKFIEINETYKEISQLYAKFGPKV